MKYSQTYKEKLGCDSDEEVWLFFKNKFIKSIDDWDCFINWSTVSNNVQTFKPELNLFNSLIGEKDVESAFKKLISEYPKLITLIPLLLVDREKSFLIIKDLADLQFPEFHYSYKRPSKEQIERICEFVKSLGLFSLFNGNQLRSIPDYVLGIEVTLNSKKRINKTGSSIEKVVENLISNIARTNGYSFISQATAKKIQVKWNINLKNYKDEKGERKYDFVIKTPQGLYFIGANFYKDGGAKLKVDANDYSGLSSFLRGQGHNFIWITDGLGWNTAIKQLEDAFVRIDHVLNLKMVMTGVLDKILQEDLK